VDLAAECQGFFQGMLRLLFPSKGKRSFDGKVLPMNDLESLAVDFIQLPPRALPRIG
jgi:hypothetical protein